MRERLAYVVLIAILIVIVAFTIAVLGRGEYAPSETGMTPGPSCALIEGPTG